VATNLPVDIYGYVLQIAYQQQETVSRNSPVENLTNLAELSYQQQETKTKLLPYAEEPTVSDTTVSGGLIWIKVVLNMVRFAFKGLAWLFDGNKFTVFPAPYVPLIWTVVVSKEGLVMAGGLKEDWSVLGDVNVFGMVMETVENFSGKDMLALVSCEKGQDVYLIDDKGNVVKKVLPSETVLFRNGWILASKHKFKAYVVRI